MKKQVKLAKSGPLADIREWLKSKQGVAVESDDLILGALQDQYAKAVMLWREESQKLGKANADSFDLAKVQKQLLIVQHIAAGRANEAITELLTPVPIAINIEVRFADDKSAIAAEREMLEKLKTLVAERINSIELRPAESGKTK